MRQTVYLCPTAEGAGGPCVLVSVCAHPCILKCLWMCDCVSVTKMRRRRRGLWRWLTQEIIWFQIQIGKKTWKLFKPYSQQQLLYQYVWFYKSGNIDIAWVHANWCTHVSRMCLVTVWYPVIWFMWCLSGVPTVGGWKAHRLWLELPNWHSFSKYLFAVYACVHACALVTLQLGDGSCP